MHCLPLPPSFEEGGAVSRAGFLAPSDPHPLAEHMFCDASFILEWNSCGSQRPRQRCDWPVPRVDAHVLGEESTWPLQLTG